MGIEAELLDGVSALLGRRDLSQRQFQDWFGGAADGGPSGDGLFPLTDGAGYTRMVPSPARQMAALESSGALPLQASIDALLHATSADVGSQLALVGVAADGTAKLFTTDLFPARTTAQVDELHSEEFAEWLLCLANGSGQERRVATASLRQSVGNVIDPTHPPYNVVYDYQKAKPVTTVAGSNQITTGDAVFGARDLGKIACVSNGDTTVGALVGYIGQIIDSKNVRLFKDKAFSVPANSNNSQGGWAEMIWGTNCTAGLQAAFDDAEPVGKYARGKVVVLGGTALATQLRFGSISIVGLSPTGTGFAALPVMNGQQPFMADKVDGVYATLRPDAYTLMNFSIHGQRYTQYYSSFRRNLDIRGGMFNGFIRGAPYPVIDGLDISEAQWDGISTAGAFAGRFANVRAFQNAQVGMRMGFWDLNGVNWHAEGNGCCGILSFMPGCNVDLVRLAYNGQDGGTTYIGGGYWPHEYGSQFTECGYGNAWTNLRSQESWSHNICFSGQDPLNATNGGGLKCTIKQATLDDTGNIAPGKNGPKTRLPGVRAMIYCKGASATNNTVDAVGSGQVQQTNYATNAYFDEGNPSGNDIEIRTPGITNAEADWYPGGVVSGQATTTAATARGPWGTSSSSSIATRGNRVEINRQVAP